MAEFKMPSLGADMDSATLVEWKVKVGDRVKRGDLIAAVETVKGVIDVEVFLDGVVEALLVAPGTVVPVDAVLARIRADAEAPAAQSPQPPPQQQPTQQPTPPPSAPRPPAPAPDAARVRVSPVARKAAATLGVSLDQVHGTGPAGAITLGDVEAAAREGPRPPAPAAAPKASAASMRAAIAAAMSRSKREIPHYYLASDVDLGPALAWLDAHNRERPVTERLLPAVLLLRAVVRAIAEVPEMNGTWAGGAFAPSAAVHLGVAINVRGGGLFAPAIVDAGALAPDALMARLNDLTLRARTATLRSSELASGTITVSNLGDLGADTVFPVIQPPQVAMVGFGRIRPRPWVVDGQVVARPIVTASLAADHRVSDGHRGGRFLAAIDRLLQHPEAL